MKFARKFTNINTDCDEDDDLILENIMFIKTSQKSIAPSGLTTVALLHK